MPTPTGFDLPPELLKRLKFRAKRDKRTLENEILHCLNLGLTRENPPERFQDRARRLRQVSHGVLRVDDLKHLIEDGRR
ncbi:hypothetical protein [Cerasicoccus frondis]|uniref:hypothetical protein n=1 Tax=Cerasicoccus frondis TaxID=490090 RepID=UPI002852AC6F|nr:hypothetical protein [Cerasicoccus frondis]